MSERLPAYLKVYQQLKNDILDEKYKVGEMIPVERQLEEIYSVSRITIRKAVELLAEDNYVEVRQGRGTRVLDYKARQSLNCVTSVTETLRKKGFTVTTKSMYIDTLVPPAHVSQNLQLEEREKAARVQRIQLADGQPIVIMKNYIPESLVPGIAGYCGQFTALYQFLEDTYHIEIDEAADKIFAKNAEFEEAQMLEVEVGEALLCIQRRCSQRGKPVCFDDVTIIGKKYELYTNMTGRNKNSI